MKFFWAALARHWFRSKTTLDSAIRRAEADLMALRPLLAHEACRPREAMEEETVYDSLAVVPIEPMRLAAPEDTTIAVRSPSRLRPRCQNANGSWM